MPTNYKVGTTVHVAPTDLLLARNIREATPDKGLVKSVQAQGVLEPITAVLTDDGELLVRFGHRRALAAIEAERDTVPVYVTGPDATETEDEILRVISQRDENTHRAGLNTAEEIGVVETLTGLGLSAAQVAKRARIPRKQVDAAVTAAASDLARKAAARYDDLTLDQAAVVAEFQDDAETVKALIAASATGRFEHVAQQARDERERAQKKAEAVDAAEQAGITLIERPAYDDKTTLGLHRLVDAATGEQITAESHAECPGHAAWIGLTWITVDAEGNPMPEDLDHDEEDPDSDPYAEARQVQVYAPEFGCQNFRTHGHRDRWDHHAQTPRAADMSEAEREEAKAQRRLVIENNKAWDSAETVRREWLATFAAAKTAPKGTSRFLAEAMSLDARLLDATEANDLAAGWLNKSRPEYGRADLSPAKSASEARCLVVTLVQVLACYEADTDRRTWRGDGTHNAAGRYLRFLKRCGYALSEVEDYALSEQTA